MDGQKLTRHGSDYPGWYLVHTGQLYFPDSVTDRVFRRKPDSRRPRRTTRNANDFVFAQGGRRSLPHLRKVGGAYVGSITLGVTR